MLLIELLGFVFLGILFFLLLLASVLIIRFRFVFGLRVRTFDVEQIDGKVTAKNPDNAFLLEYERILRKTAYAQVEIEKPDSFYDDSDLHLPFQFTVVYHPNLNIPLLSSRNITDNQFLQRLLNENTTALSGIESGNQILCDRLSGNLSDPLFRKYRNVSFAFYYAEIYKRYKQKTMFLMARSESSERLLSKYIRVGFYLIGEKLHNGKKHWILRQDVQQLYPKLREQALLFLIVKLKK